jgi:two-component system, cell cycle response regulator
MPAHILVIEDNAPSLELITYLLQAFEYAVSTAADGGDGLEAIRSKSPDLVVCDVHLPTMSGYDVAREMKQDPAMKDIPLIAVTALAMVGDRDKVLSAGFDGYIAKPIAPELFIEQVEKFLGADQHSQARPKLHVASSPSPNSSSASGLATILVVDDVDVNIILTKTILEPFGYRINTAASVREGILAFQQTNPDLIIADVHLKDGSGYDLLQRIKGESSLNLKPVLFISGSADPSDHLRVLEVGAVKLLVRPVEPELLLAEVAAALRSAERT